MNSTIDRAAVFSWFTGKPAEKAAAALDALAASLAQGYWVKGASRSARAALSKANVAAKLARANESWLERLGVPDGVNTYAEEYREIRQIGFDIYMSLAYGNFERILVLDLGAALNAAVDPFQSNVIHEARRYAGAFGPVAEAIRELDATRPPPTFTALGVSPTITATLDDMGFSPASKVSVCPIRWERRESVDKDGEEAGLLRRRPALAGGHPPRDQQVPRHQPEPAVRGVRPRDQAVVQLGAAGAGAGGPAAEEPLGRPRLRGVPLRDQDGRGPGDRGPEGGRAVSAEAKLVAAARELAGPGATDAQVAGLARLLGARLAGVLGDAEAPTPHEDSHPLKMWIWGLPFFSVAATNPRLVRREWGSEVLVDLEVRAGARTVRGVQNHPAKHGRLPSAGPLFWGRPPEFALALEGLSEDEAVLYKIRGAATDCARGAGF